MSPKGLCFSKHRVIVIAELYFFSTSSSRLFPWNLNRKEMNSSSIFHLRLNARGNDLINDNSKLKETSWRTMLEAIHFVLESHCQGQKCEIIINLCYSLHLKSNSININLNNCLLSQKFWLLKANAFHFLDSRELFYKLNENLDCWLNEFYAKSQNFTSQKLLVCFSSLKLWKLLLMQFYNEDLISLLNWKLEGLKKIWIQLKLNLWSWVLTNEREKILSRIFALCSFHFNSQWM